jgi:pimeloyl-ACP methyl ester carboxylesterase
MARPIFASAKRLGGEALDAARADRLRHTAHGLANSLRGMGAGAQPPLHASLPRLELPVLLVTGELDPKFRAIAADLRGRLHNARIEVVPGAGHAAHLERPDHVVGLALHFFREADSLRPEFKPTRNPAS